MEEVQCEEAERWQNSCKEELKRDEDCNKENLKMGEDCNMRSWRWVKTATREVSHV